MPEEVLKYRVEIDQSDLATQLASIKSQLDQAMGAMSFTEMNKNLPADPLTQGLANFADVATATGDKFQESIASSRDFVLKSLESGRLGFDKFRDDMYRQGLTSPPAYAYQSDFGTAQNATLIPEFEKFGFLKSGLASKFGFGYDNDMPLSRGQYMRGMGKLNDEKAENVKFWGSLAATGALTIANPAAGAAVATAQALYEIPRLLDMDTEPTKEFARFIQESSFRNSKQLSPAESLNAAKSIRRLAETGKVRGEVGDETDVENLVSEFSAMGGFRDTSNVEQFKQRAKETVENFRKVQHAIQGSTQDALATMADVIQGGLATGSADAAGLIGNAASLGRMTGTDTSEMLQIAQRGAEMVRGSGYSMSEAGRDAMNMYANVRANFDTDLVKEAGGSLQVAETLQTIGYNFANSPSGQLAAAAQIGGLTGGRGSVTDIFGAVNTAIGGIGGVGDALDMVVKMDKVRQSTSADSQLDTMDSYNFERLKSLGLQNITQDQYAGFLMKGGTSSMQARLIAERAWTSPDVKREQYFRGVADDIQREEDEKPGALGEWWNDTKAGTKKFLREQVSETVAGAYSASDSYFGALYDDIFKGSDDVANDMVKNLRGEALFGRVSQLTLKDFGKVDSNLKTEKDQKDWNKTINSNVGEYRFNKYEERRYSKDIATSMDDVNNKIKSDEYANMSKKEKFTMIGTEGSFTRMIAVAGTDGAKGAFDNPLLKEYQEDMFDLIDAGLDITFTETEDELNEKIAKASQDDNNVTLQELSKKINTSKYTTGANAANVAAKYEEGKKALKKEIEGIEFGTYTTDWGGLDKNDGLEKLAAKMGNNKAFIDKYGEKGDIETIFNKGDSVGDIQDQFLNYVSGDSEKGNDFYNQINTLEEMIALGNEKGIDMNQAEIQLANYRKVEKSKAGQAMIKTKDEAVAVEGLSIIKTANATEKARLLRTNDMTEKEADGVVADLDFNVQQATAYNAAGSDERRVEKLSAFREQKQAAADDAKYGDFKIDGEGGGDTNSVIQSNTEVMKLILKNLQAGQSSSSGRGVW